MDLDDQWHCKRLDMSAEQIARRRGMLRPVSIDELEAKTQGHKEPQVFWLLVASAATLVLLVAAMLVGP